MDFNKKTIKTILYYSILTAIIIGGVYYYRAEISLYTWDNYRLFPQTTIVLSGDADFAVEIGNYYFNGLHNGVYDLEKAEKYFKVALAIDPEVKNAWFQLSRIDFLRGDFYLALWKINKQIEIHGDSKDNVYYIRGLIYGYDRQFEKAEKDFITFLKYREKSWAGYNDLAWIYFQQGKYEKAEEAARDGLVYHPTNMWLLTMRGVSLLNLGRKEEARGELEEALTGAKKLTEEDWHMAYPGNDPRIAKQGLSEMVKAIEHNIALVD